MWRMSDNALVQTTSKKLAEEKGIYNKEMEYEPQLVVVGKDATLKGIQNAIKSMDVGQSKKIEIKPDEAFGERSNELVRVMPIAEFRKHDMEPAPGMQVDIDGAVAVVRSVNSGRVTVDANHPLAGETLSVELKVVSKIDQESERVKAIFTHYRVKPDKVEVKEKTARVTFGPNVKKDARFLIDKSSAIGMSIQYIDGLNKIVVEEEYARETPEKK